MSVKHDYINLLPRIGKTAARTGYTRGGVWLALYLLVWAGAFGWQWMEERDARARLAGLADKKQALQQELNALYQELGIAAPSAGMTPEQNAIIAGLLSERVVWSEVFRQFSLVVPKGLWFDSLEGTTEGKAEIKIKGGALNYLGVSELMLALDKSGYFVSPQLIYAQKITAQGQDVIGFEIVCGIRKGQGRV